MAPPIITGVSITPWTRPNSLHVVANVDPNGGGVTTIRLMAFRPNQLTYGGMGKQLSGNYSLGPFPGTSIIPVDFYWGNLPLDAWNPAGFDTPWQYTIHATNSDGTTTTPLVTVNLVGPGVAPTTASDGGGGIYVNSPVAPAVFPSGVVDRCRVIISSAPTVDTGGDDTDLIFGIGTTPGLGQFVSPLSNPNVSTTTFGSAGSNSPNAPSVWTTPNWRSGDSKLMTIDDFGALGIAPGGTYYYNVDSVTNSFGSIGPGAVSGPFTAPIDDSSATSPSLSAITSSSMTVTYNYNAQGTSVGGVFPQEYRLQRSIGNAGPWSTVETFTGTSTGTRTFNDTGLSPGVNYCYRVYLPSCRGAAFDRIYTGGASCATTPFPCPTLLIATAASSITLSSAVINGSMANLWGRVAQVRLEWGTSPGFGQLTPIQNVTNPTGAATSFAPETLTGLLAGTTYYYRWTANVPGCGTVISATNTFTTLSVPPCLVPTVTASPATSITTGSATLNGVVNNHNEAGSTYQFEFKLASNPSWVGATTTGLVALPASLLNQNVVGAIGSLSPNTTYDFRVCMVVGCGQSSCSTPLQFTTLPAPPPAPVVTTQNTGCAGASTTTLAMAAFVNPNGLATTYAFEYTTDPAFLVGVVTSPGGSAGAGVVPVNVGETITGLTPGTTYYYRVTATNGSGTNVGAILNCTTSPLPPPVPTIVSSLCASATTTGITFTASINPNGLATSVVVQYGTTVALGSVSAAVNAGSGVTATTVTIPVTGLVPGTNYFWRVVATNGSGSNFSTISSCPTDSCAVPVSAAASNITISGARMEGTLTNVPPSQSSYYFEWGASLGFGNVTPTTVGTTNNVFFDLTTLLSGTQYYYRLCVVAEPGCTNSCSATQTFTTSGAPPCATISAVTTAPTLVTQTTATFNGTVDNFSTASTYYFEYKVSSSAGWAGALSSPVTALGAGVGPQAVSFAATGLTPNTSYKARLCASNGCGNSSCGTDQVFSTLVVPPPAPTVITTVDSCPGATVTGLTFSGSVNPNGLATTVLFEYTTDSAFLVGIVSTPGVAIGSGVVAVPVSAPVTGLTPGTIYYYRVSATNGSGTNVGAIASCTTLPTPPPAPTVGSVSCGTATQTSINFLGSVNPNGLPTSVTVSYGLTAALGSTSAAVNAGSGVVPVAITVPVTGLTPGTTYFWRINATNSSGINVSSIITCATNPTPPPVPTIALDADPCILATTTTLTFEAVVDPGGLSTNVVFEWGIGSAVGNISPTITISGGSQTVTYTATGLIPGTVYFWKVSAVNIAGSVTSQEVTCVTSTPPAPVVVTNPASFVEEDMATLNATVDPSGCTTATTYFEYGTTVALGSSTSPQSVSGGAQNVQANISGLFNSTQYFFRACLDCDGSVVCGNIRSFTTAVVPPTPADDCNDIQTVELCHTQSVVVLCDANNGYSPVKVHTIYNRDGEPIPAGTVDYLGNPIGTIYTDLNDNVLNPGSMDLVDCASRPSSRIQPWGSARIVGVTPSVVPTDVSSITLVVLIGDVTVTGSQHTGATLPVGSWSWSVDNGNSLESAVSFVGATASTEYILIYVRS